MNGETIDVDFQTNALIGAPFNDTVRTDYSRSQFRYHVVVSGSVGQDDLRFDASNSYLYEYGAGAYWQMPVTGWPFPAYLFGTGGNGYGLINHYILPQGTSYKMVVPIDFTPPSLVNN